MFWSNRRMGLGVLMIFLALTAITVVAQSSSETTAEQNKALITTYLEAISGKEKPAALQDQYIGESDQALKDHIAMFEAGFPKYELIVDDMIAEGDKVVVRATFRGTQNGDFAGIAATNKDVEIPLIIIYRIGDGKIVEHWMQADVIGLMQQLGALPTPEPSS